MRREEALAMANRPQSAGSHSTAAGGSMASAMRMVRLSTGLNNQLRFAASTTMTRVPAWLG